MSISQFNQINNKLKFINTCIQSKHHNAVEKKSFGQIFLNFSDINVKTYKSV